MIKIRDNEEFNNYLEKEHFKLLKKIYKRIGIIDDMLKYSDEYLNQDDRQIILEFRNKISLGICNITDSIKNSDLPNIDYYKNKYEYNELRRYKVYNYFTVHFDHIKEFDIFLNRFKNRERQSLMNNLKLSQSN